MLIDANRVIIQVTRLYQKVPNKYAIVQFPYGSPVAHSPVGLVKPIGRFSFYLILVFVRSLSVVRFCP